ncbi:capsid triplex subunit 1 [Equid alphaherpesvirus 3]|uniref:Capsid triplex subunit 1 n=1 Tax=Equid alphaherpesvirus 3 TaxID=80341 RepID=A0A077B7J3_9ALPH|nr:capsid triplex subunit 1 [Equid alphaherpesvirus 3]AIL02939.1 capsid triplex subunit 1 [Equid alphaherpesvirus 3]
MERGGGNRFVQIGNGMRTVMRTNGTGVTWWEQLPPRGRGFPPQQDTRGPTTPTAFAPPNTLDWLPGVLQVTPSTITLHNMTGIQITSGIVGAAIGAEQASWQLSSCRPEVRLTRQVTLTDFCDPQAERPGVPILSLRNPLDATGMATASTPPGRNPQELEEAWAALADLATGRCEGGLRASLISLPFLVAARAGEYADRAAAEAVRAHVLANYKDRRAEQRLERFGECLQAMVRSHVFPHQHIGLFGGLLTHVVQDKLASVTAVARGVQEGARTDRTGAPRSSVYVPACAFLDVDHDLKLGEGGAKYLYLVFVYGQRLRREGVRAYLALARFDEVAFEDAVSFLFYRARTENAIRGTEGADAPDPAPNAAFPLVELAGDPHEARCPPSRLKDAEFVGNLYQWTPDLRGRANRNSCLYAAYMRLGAIPSDCPKTVRRGERFGNVDVPVVWLENVRWEPGSWVECSY